MLRAATFLFITFIASSCSYDPSKRPSSHVSHNENCARFLPSNYLPSNRVADIWVAPNHRQKFWTWGNTDYSNVDEFAESGHLYSFDYVHYGPSTRCKIVEASNAKDVGSLNISRDVMYLLVLNSAPISLRNIADFTNLKAIALVHTDARDVFSTPPASLHSIILIDSTFEAADVDHLPKM